MVSKGQEGFLELNAQWMFNDSVGLDLSIINNDTAFGRVRIAKAGVRFEF